MYWLCAIGCIKQWIRTQEVDTAGDSQNGPIVLKPTSAMQSTTNGSTMTSVKEDHKEFGEEQAPLVASTPQELPLNESDGGFP